MVKRLAYRDGQCSKKLNRTLVAVKRPQEDNGATLSQLRL
jgi:hypothetical protein